MIGDAFNQIGRPGSGWQAVDSPCNFEGVKVPVPKGSEKIWWKSALETLPVQKSNRLKLIPRRCSSRIETKLRETYRVPLRRVSSKTHRRSFQGAM